MGKGGESAMASADDKAMQKISWEEVKKHSSPSDAWIVHSNKVYDVSDW